jgi:hypothetical protein
MRVRAVLVTLTAVAAVLWPMVRRPPVDSMPLSTYPMFTQLRPRVATIELAVGLDAEGRDVRLDPEAVGGTVEVIQAVATVGRSIRESRADDLCREVAQRLAQRRSAAVAVAVVTDRYDVVEALVSPGPPQHRTIHARCPVRS